MAVKKGTKTSKTAKSSTRAGATTSSSKFVRSSDTPVFIPLGGGQYSYTASADGKSLHCQVGSAKMNEALDALIEAGYTDRALAEAKKLAVTFPMWSQVVEHLTPKPVEAAV